MRLRSRIPIVGNDTVVVGGLPRAGEGADQPKAPPPPANERGKGKAEGPPAGGG